MIIDASPYDIAQLGKLGRAFVERSITSQFMSFDEEGFVNSLFRLTHLGIMRVWVAKEQGTIVGAIGLIVSPNPYNPREILGDIYFVDVLPEYQKQGIARELIGVVDKWAIANGLKALTISFKDEALAERMCDKAGFVMFEYKLIKKVGD